MYAQVCVSFILGQRGEGLFFNIISWACMQTFDTYGLSLDLLGLLVMAHLVNFRSRCDHSENFCSLWMCGYLFDNLSVMMTRSSTQVVALHVIVEVLKWYSMLFFPNHRKSGSRKMMKRYGLIVSPCIVPMVIKISGVAPKQLPWKEVVEFMQRLPVHSPVSLGQPRSSIRASNLAWSMKPKAFLKSMYVR